MAPLLSNFSLCDYDDAPGSCLTEKTHNTSDDAQQHLVTVCNGCGKTHNCAVIPAETLLLRDGVQLVAITPTTPQRKQSAKAGKKSLPKRQSAKKR